jgi:hypothetical protein
MGNMSTIQITYVLLASGLILFWLVLVVLGPRKIDVPNVVAVLRYGVALRTIALALALTLPLIMVYCVWAFLWRNQNMLNLAGMSFLACSIIAGLWLIEVTRVQVVLTEEGIRAFSPWRGSVTLKWLDVESVRYSALNSWFILRGAGQTVRVSKYLSGVGAFVEIVRRKVAAERWVSALAVMDALK